MITQAELKQVLHYDPETGVMSWMKYGFKNGKMKVAGCVGRNGYRSIRTQGVSYQAHNLIWLYMTGALPVHFVDHINHVRGDNRWVNLTESSAGDNQHNRKMNKNNKSGTMGVYYLKKGTDRARHWMATIKIGDEFEYLGLFYTKEEAVKARKDAELKHGFHPNHGQVLDSEHKYYQGR